MKTPLDQEFLMDHEKFLTTNGTQNRMLQGHQIFWQAGAYSEQERVFRFLQPSIFTEHLSEKITLLKSSLSTTIFKQCFMHLAC